MAGLLSPGPSRLETELLATIRQWASSPCDPFPCARDTLVYACRVSRVAVPRLPAHGGRRDISRVLKANGGLVAYAGTMMAQLGWETVGTPARGDVGVVDIPAMGLTCAICLEGPGDIADPALWMARGDRQLLVITAPHRQAWSMSCPRP
ncbi:hypothetical protein KRZ98_06190 [Sphingobium sp. AS12]|uniref:hypothetical protein n=1 Tax=Sphingobium sp. AS12 TaxID=2849495 RepID=UPI001C3159D3|nr:hypothetical protein [Sphingobium sp. AS12]MBV2147879.1 hypothetical protein [Sphingobium sp. AS12]